MIEQKRKEILDCVVTEVIEDMFGNIWNELDDDFREAFRSDIENACLCDSSEEAMQIENTLLKVSEWIKMGWNAALNWMQGMEVEIYAKDSQDVHLE